MKAKKKIILEFIDMFIKLKSSLECSDTKALKLIKAIPGKDDSDLLSRLKVIYTSNLNEDQKVSLDKLASCDILETYLKVIQAIIIARSNNNVKAYDLEKNLNLSNGVISHLESLRYFTSLLTFIQICKELNLIITLSD